MDIFDYMTLFTVLFALSFVGAIWNMGSPQDKDNEEGAENEQRKAD